MCVCERYGFECFHLFRIQTEERQQLFSCMAHLSFCVFASLFAAEDNAYPKKTPNMFLFTGVYTPRLVSAALDQVIPLGGWEAN